MKKQNEIHLIKSLDGKFTCANDSDLELSKKIKVGETYKFKFSKPRKGNRSNRQNRYYWGVIVAYWKDLLYSEWGEHYSIEETHEFLKVNFNFDEKVNEDTGEILRKLKSTTNNDTSEMEVYSEICRRKAYEFFNTQIPLPNEDED
jgi:hypothetical protein